jgi:(5-formylfuran-3-yl)methyl phosphate synthase
MTELLVSVRNAVEADAALAGGAALIDVKEPDRGALGRAEDSVITDVVRAVQRRCPVSAALGELRDANAAPAPPGLAFVKWGLAGAAQTDWRGALQQRQKAAGPQVVIVGYADWQCALAPPVDEVVAYACSKANNILLIDTCCKDPARLSLRRRPTLLDWMHIEEAVAICRQCRSAGVRVALAGSLGIDEIAKLLPAEPDWFAVRGAVCQEGLRGAAVERARVADLSGLLKMNTKRLESPALS